MVENIQEYVRTIVLARAIVHGGKNSFDLASECKCYDPFVLCAGAYMGPVVGFPLAGVITDYLGWPYIYYFFGEYAYVINMFKSD